MVGVFLAWLQVVHQRPQMFLPFFGARTLQSFDKCPLKQFQRLLVKIFVNAVRMRRLITVRPKPVCVVIFFDSVLNGQHFDVIFARNARKRMNAVVQQFENHHRQRKFVLFFAHFVTAEIHALRINIFFTDEFCRITIIISPLIEKPSQSTIATIIVSL